MATKRVDASGLKKLVNQYLDEYGKSVYEAVEKASATTAKALVKQLRQGGSYNTGEVGKKYNRGWTAEQQVSRMTSSKTMIAPTIVFNKDVPGLAHLLEYGHAKRNGGRTTEFNYIRPAVDSVEDRFAEEVIKEMT